MWWYSGCHSQQWPSSKDCSCANWPCWTWVKWLKTLTLSGMIWMTLLVGIHLDIDSRMEKFWFWVIRECRNGEAVTTCCKVGGLQENLGFKDRIWCNLWSKNALCLSGSFVVYFALSSICGLLVGKHTYCFWENWATLWDSHEIR